jgi:hypothetical protein
LRYKQFVSQTVLDKSKEFLGSEKSYRKTVRFQQRPLVYDDRLSHPLAERGAALAHSSVWRWLSWLGGLTRTFQKGCQLISQKDPHSTLHREVIPIDPKKYCGEEGCPRHQLLERAGRMLLLEAVFYLQLGKRIFPRFATARQPPLAQKARCNPPSSM